LEAEEARLVSIKAIEDGALHWHVVDNLLTVIASVFAMGPAWTIMRSLSTRPPMKDDA